MKENPMNKYLLTTSLILLNATLNLAHASEGQFAVLKTDRACDINVPNGYSKSQVYFSKDCSTAFILPGEKLSGHISNPIFLAGSDDNFCNALSQQSSNYIKYYEKIHLLEDQIEKSLNKIANANSEQRASLESQIQELRKQIAIYKNEILNIFKPYDDMAAVRVKYTLTSNIMESVQAFQEANLITNSNPNVTYPIRIMPAQIADSTLVISNPDADAYMGRAVLKINFPGFKARPQEYLTDDPNATFVAMNGGLSGIVDISTSAYCRNKDQTTKINEIIGKSIALNLFYNVKVQTGIKLFVDAKIKTVDFLQNINSTITKGKFLRREFTDSVLSGGLEGSIHIALDDKGKEYDLISLINGRDENDELNPLSGLIGKAILKELKIN